MTRGDEIGALADTDDAAIRDAVRRWELAWNSGDMAAAASLFCDDADFVNVLGSHWRGREQIEREHVARHRLQLRDSIFTARHVDVRPIRPGVALAHVAWAIRGDHDSDGTLREPRQGLFTWVMLKSVDGRWQVRAAHNVHTAPHPAALK